VPFFVHDIREQWDMEVQTFRAHSMQEALRLIRNALGPDAAVLQAKEVGRGAMSWLTGAREIEVLALSGVHLPSQFAEPAGGGHDAEATLIPAEELVYDPAEHLPVSETPHLPDYRSKFRADLRCEDAALESLVEKLCAAPRYSGDPDWAPALHAQMLRAEISPSVARDLLTRMRCLAADAGCSDALQLLLHAQRILEQEIRVSGPIRLGSVRPHVVALIGPTGVGKTTTVAKLAAEFRLRRRVRVGLITVDADRAAAVEQFRAYAEMIEVPLEVVSSHREMRLAAGRLSGLDLILIDTAGRSPREIVRIQELKSLLGEARADEVHLVLSATAGASSLIHAARRFQPLGPTALLLTKLDEAAAVGGLLSLLQDCGLPLSYLADGQHVPEDIRAADPGRLARLMLGLDPVSSEA
jgi:flagellar biosynthesis protein FlhF